MYRYATVQDAVEQEIKPALQPYADDFDLGRMADFVVQPDGDKVTVVQGEAFWEAARRSVRGRVFGDADANETTLF
jgi:hypothetical protein|nr:MAG TPA: hypothetical protein [Caudoviricetes sp.]